MSHAFVIAGSPDRHEWRVDESVHWVCGWPATACPWVRQSLQDQVPIWVDGATITTVSNLSFDFPGSCVLCYSLNKLALSRSPKAGTASVFCLSAGTASFNLVFHGAAEARLTSLRSVLVTTKRAEWWLDSTTATSTRLPLMRTSDCLFCVFRLFGCAVT